MAIAVHPDIRFLNKLVRKRLDECWDWLGAKTQDGYGRIVVKNKKVVGAHRYSYQYFTRDRIPKNYFVCHKCDNPGCVNPNHLFIGKPRDNSKDMVLKGRSFRPEQKGELNKNSRLTERDVKNIRSRYSKGESVKEIVNSLGEQYMAIWLICTRKTWRHI